jgi:predicted secreted protein
MATTFLVVIALAAVACSGEEAQSPSSTTGTTAVVGGEPSGTGPLDYPAYRDPAQPIHAALGRRFALRFDAEPSAGFSWQLANTPDPGVVLPIGTEFRGETTGTAINASVVQYLSFAASGTGETTIEVRYVSPSGAPAPDTAPMVFTVIVTLTGEPPPPVAPGTTLTD